jgi:hypothetical protein
MGTFTTEKLEDWNHDEASGKDLNLLGNLRAPKERNL